MTKIEAIFHGWAKYGLLRLGWKPAPEDYHLAEKRLYICDECPIRKNNKCTKCSCNLMAKTLVKTERCPEGKW